MRSKKIFVVTFLVVIALCMGVGLVSHMSKQTGTLPASLKLFEPIIYEKEIEISLGENPPNSKDYSTEFTHDILWFDNSMGENINKVGEYKGIIISGGRFYPVVLTVVDKNPPIIQNVKDITIYVGDNINLESQVTVVDDSLDNVSLTVKGEYSISKEGTYSLTYQAVDSSGNKATADFTLIVKKKSVQKPNNNTSTTVGKSSKGYSIVQSGGAYYVNGILVANKTYALSSTYAPGGLSKETSDAFGKMQQDAQKQGISLKIISGYRSYSRQQTLYNNYVKRDGKKEADRYSARPGHSEHQTGLAFDVNSLEQSFGNTETGKWLSDNCYKYGFILRYPKGKEEITGYMYEPWHFRYIGSKASELYHNGSWITLEEYLGIDSEYAS